MAQSLLKMANDLVLAHIQAGHISPEQVSELLTATHQQLVLLHAIEETGSAPSPAQPVDWKQSITQHAVQCLECGASFKQLSRHFRAHELDSQTYRQKYGIPRGQALSAKATTARRKKMTRETRLWEKAPTYQKSHGQSGDGAAVTQAAATPTSRAPAKRKTRAKTKAKQPAARKKS